jgi:ubiquinol-cytochrome c reductase cytochrome b/c1 subunit
MSGHVSTFEPKSRAAKWWDERLPIARLMHGSFVEFPTPRNLNYLWTFGGILSFFMIAQIVTGIVLAMHYQPSDAAAFNSIEHIRRDVNYGWMIRNFHSVGASFFFIAVYIHIFRGLYYGSYKAPREVLWVLGVLIFLVMMATAFLGYTLPWGQMSFWGVTVITNLFSSLDTIYQGLGTAIVEWLWGSYAVSGATLNRFFSLHYLLPFVLFGIVILHIWALHTVGQNNPTGLEIKEPSESVPMHPYATSKDVVGMFAFLLVYAWFCFFLPDYLGHADNYIEANPLVTPPHIVPEWYFLPFYAILRAFTGTFLGFIPLGSYAKLLGVVAMFGAVALLAFVPWLDTSRVRSAKYRPIFKWVFWAFVFVCVALGYLGSKPAEGSYVTWAQIYTVLYFLFFLVALPVIGIIETPKKLPRSITEAVLGPDAAAEVAKH